MRLNNIGYPDDEVELMDMAYMYGWQCTKQMEKFRDFVPPTMSTDDLIAQWADCEAAYNLLRETWGKNFIPCMLDYMKELRKG